MATADRVCGTCDEPIAQRFLDAHPGATDCAKCVSKTEPKPKRRLPITELAFSGEPDERLLDRLVRIARPAY